MVIYLSILLVWVLFIEWVFELTEGKLTTELRVINALFFPLMVVFFIKVFFDKFFERNY